MTDSAPSPDITPPHLRQFLEELEKGRPKASPIPTLDGKERTPDFVRGHQPLTRIEAFFLASKLKRLIATSLDIALSVSNKDIIKLRSLDTERKSLSDELNSLIDSLVFVMDDRDDS